MKPLLVLVGGFLGSGKTTLLLNAAARLGRAGYRVALITNDQGGNLVDTRLAGAAGLDTAEIPGGCFCCRFSDLLAAADTLLAYDVILAEPVGSCMDIVATVIEPMRRYHGDRFRLAPYTVLVDPQRADELLAPAADPKLAYLFGNQLAEADLVCFSRADAFTHCPDLPTGFAHRLSGTTGAGIDEWLREVLAGTAGSRILDIDYGKYAEAEAALGWLNYQATIRLRSALSPSSVIGPLLDDVARGFSEAGLDIAHVKLFDDCPAGYLKASICRNGEEPFVQGDLTASPSARHDLLLNARARGAPELMLSIVREAVATLPGTVSEAHVEAFRPSPPNPQFRFDKCNRAATVRELTQN